MSNAVYPSALDAFGVGAIDYITDPIKVGLLNATYVYSASHEHLDDLVGTIGSAEALTGKSVADGEFFADDVVIPSVAAGSTVRAFVVFLDSGTPATSPLICFVDTRADTVPINLSTNGGDITIAWPSGRVFKI